MEPTSDIRLLFHKLNNQLGIILSHAELLEAKATDTMNRSRAALVVSSVLEAMGTTKELRSKMSAASPAAAPDPDATIAAS
jgi:transcriptional antiterminator Rof (Rho-off)